MPEAPASTHKRASSPRSTPLTITGSAASAQSHARSSIEAPEYRPLNDASGAGISQNAGGGGGGAVRPPGIQYKIGRAHVGTPVTNAHLVCRLQLEKNKTST